MFADVPSRYPILALILRVFSTRGQLPPLLALSRSAFLDAILTSTLVDKSAPLFEREIVLLLIVVPYFAVYAHHKLLHILPTLLAALGRALSWNAESPAIKLNTDESDDDENRNEDIRRVPRGASGSFKAVFHDKRTDDTAAQLHSEISNLPLLEWNIAGLSPSTLKMYASLIGRVNRFTTFSF